MNNNGFEKLAEVIAKSLIKDYYDACRRGDKKAMSEAESGLRYWEAALPMPVDNIISLIKEQFDM